MISPEPDIPYAHFVIDALIADVRASGGRPDLAIPTVRSAGDAPDNPAQATASVELSNGHDASDTHVVEERDKW